MLVEQQREIVMTDETMERLIKTEIESSVQQNLSDDLARSEMEEIYEKQTWADVKEVEVYTIRRVSNGWSVKTGEDLEDLESVFQDDYDAFSHSEAESLFRLLQDVFGEDYGRRKKQGGMTIEFNDEGPEKV